MIRNLIGGLSGGGGGGGDIWADERGGEDQVQAREPNDFTPYVDFAPLSVSQNSSMEMVVELFVKIGIKTLLIVQDGRFVGKIHKKKLLHYLEHQKTRRH